ncbi:MAG TPA: EF-hand domain-containing protein, partial [Planctomycetaceae bacterium]|nr:EF-hand domain-containing protein [Planctomycetaceae bacterium]
MISQCRTSSVRRIEYRIGGALGLLCASALTFLLVDGQAEELPQPLSVSVVFNPSSPEKTDSRMEMTPASADATQPTLPGGKLPQYQLTPRLNTVDTDEQIEDSKVRFLLALPNEPIMIEAAITIDGVPFRQKREQRVQEALNAILQPPSEQELSAETEVVSVDDTNPADDSEAADEEKPLRAEREEEPAESRSSNAYQSATSAVEKLRRYTASIGREPTLAEVRWFFVHRMDGPTLLLLRDSFQAFRADQTPLFHILDRNRDGTISSAEIAQSVESFLDCDLNRNEVVDYRELNEVANDPRLKRDPPAGSSPLLFLIPDEAHAGEIYSELLAAYVNSPVADASLPPKFDPNSNGRWELEELNRLRTMTADIELNIRFDTASPEKSAVTISETSLSASEAENISARIVNSSIVISREDCEIWFSANQLQAGDQISIGAVNDGYPMLPVLDPNDDGRFTLRELRGLAESLKQFDRNQDGQIQKDELRPTIRVAFGMGPYAHQALAGIRSVNSSATSSVSGPEWFVRMDRNKDGDLTRQEFPGTDAQFAELNADG